MSTKNCRTCRVFVEKILYKVAVVVAVVVISLSFICETMIRRQHSNTWILYDESFTLLDLDIVRAIVHTIIIGTIVVLCSIREHEGNISFNLCTFLSFPVVGFVFWLSNDAYLIVDKVFFWIKVSVIVLTLLVWGFILLILFFMSCLEVCSYFKKLWQDSVQEVEEDDEEVEEHQNINKDVDLETPEHNNDI